MVNLDLYPIGLPLYSTRNKYIIPALIGAGAAIVGGILSRKGAKQANDANYDFQREMWNKQVAQQDKINAQQMAYQDKVNAENRAWSDESAVRQRVEDAGYNPYLYNGQASANSAGTASSANLGNSVTAGAISPVNEYEGLSSSLGTVGSVMAQGVDTAIKSYDLSRKKKVDKLNDTLTGQTGGLESQQQQALLATTKQDARTKAATAAFQELENAVLSSQAYDVNGHPMVDESSGRPISLAEQRERGQQAEVFNKIAKLKSAVLKDQVDWENTSVDTLLKRYQLEKSNPEQLAILRQTLSNLQDENLKIKSETKLLGSQLGVNQSVIELNNSSSALNAVLSKLNMQKKLTEEQQTKLAAWNAYIQSDKDLTEMVRNITPNSDVSEKFVKTLLDTSEDYVNADPQRTWRVKRFLLRKFGNRKGMAKK